jgi:hypothetical protein
VNSADETLMDDFSLFVEASTRYAGGEPVELVTVEYAVNDLEYVSMNQGAGHNFTATLSPSDIGKGSHLITIKTTDDKGLVVEKRFPVLFGAEAEKDEEGINVMMAGGVSLILLIVAALIVLKRGKAEEEDDYFEDDPDDVIF